MKKLAFIFFIIILCLGFVFLSDSLNAEDNNTSINAEQESPIEVIFFYSDICPHCADESEFLEKLKGEYDIEISKFLVSEDDNVKLLIELYNDYNVPSEFHGYVPVTFISDRYFVGYDTRDNIGWKIEHYIQKLVVERLEQPEDPEDPEQPEDPEESNRGEVFEQKERKVSIPFIGEFKINFQEKKINAKLAFIGDVGINFSNKSPLFIAILFGALDGFNACAMVALGFLLAVLIGTGTRKRILLIGGTFILVSGLVYFLIISAWLELFLILSNVKFITTLIGVVIIIFSVSLLRDYMRGVTCKICELDKSGGNFLTRFQNKLFEKMEMFSSDKVSLPLALLGIAMVAAGVNMVELCCSIGLPVAFTKMLSSFSLSRLSSHFYILVYVTFYMLDDFIIFLFAVLAMRITQASEKYFKVVKLISGIMLLILGIIMLIRPEFLAF